jgi:hypothetical protein
VCQEAEEAALNLESFDPIDLDDENKMVLMDSEVVAWLEENRLSGSVQKPTAHPPTGPGPGQTD